MHPHSHRTSAFETSVGAEEQSSMKARNHSWAYCATMTFGEETRKEDPLRRLGSSGRAQKVQMKLRKCKKETKNFGDTNISRKTHYQPRLKRAASSLPSQYR